MSTFKGLFDEDELKDIAADYFEPSVHHCEAFFLSHAHTDHMSGLDANFGQHLKEHPEKRIYCSLITKEFFFKLDKFCNGFDEDSLIVLDIGTPHLLSVCGQYMTVTLIPAGHCPGSVMFLFEVKSVCVLFTGDFRYDAKDISKLKLLNNPDGSVKRIDNIYLDTTFAFEEYKDFPSRDQSLEAILSEIGKWVKVNKDNIVNLELPARFAYEFVFVSIFEYLNMKVHVPKSKIDLYKNISDIFHSVTSDSSSQIHACSSNASCIRCEEKKPLTIRLCTMLFKDSFVQNCGGGLYKNCDASEIKIFYATHSSLNELRSFVNYIAPIVVTPFVIPPGYGVTLEILRDRVLKLPDTPYKRSSSPFISQLSAKKSKLEFNESPLQLKLDSTWNLLSSTNENKSQVLLSAGNARIKYYSIESPPSSPDSS